MCVKPGHSIFSHILYDFLVSTIDLNDTVQPMRPKQRLNPLLLATDCRFFHFVDPTRSGEVPEISSKSVN